MIPRAPTGTMKCFPRSTICGHCWPAAARMKRQKPANSFYNCAKRVYFFARLREFDVRRLEDPLPAPSPNTPSDAVKRLLPWLVAVAFFMESLDTTILNTAVPMIARALAVTPLSMKAVLASYTLSLAVFIPISSWMADRFGTRRVFASAIGVFTVGSLLCGLSTDIHTLVACRILQGFGGAMMVPVGRLTLVRSFARSELVR